MVAFTHKDVAGDDFALHAQIFELGKQSILPPYAACSPYPYPSEQSILESANLPDRYFIAVYADGVLNAAMGFQKADGMVTLSITKPFASPEDVAAGKIDPRGIQQWDYICGVIKDRCGKVVSQNPNPEAWKIEARGKVPVERRPRNWM